MATKMTVSSEIQLRVLNAKRDVYFAKLERLVGLSKNIDFAENIDEFASELSTLDTTIHKLEEIVNEINVIAACADEDFKPDFSMLDEIDSMVGKIRQCEKEIFGQSGASELKNTLKVNCKLPKINLITFSGDSRDWPLFYENFRTLIHENKSLDNTSKFYYLVGALRGKALDMCTGIVPSAANYSVIWKLLVDKYQDKRLLASAYLRQIINFKPLKDCSSSSLDSFIERFDSNVNSLLQVEISNLGDFILTSIALSKLPPQLQKEFETQWNKTDMPEYLDLLSFIKNQARALNRIGAGRLGVEANIQKSSPKTYGFKPASQSFAATSSSSIGKFKKGIAKGEPSFCSMCKKAHVITSCPEFLACEAHQRYNIVREKDLCLVCLGSNHRLLACKTNKNCSVCQKRHHTLLHFEKSATEEIEKGIIESSPKDSTIIQNFCSVGNEIIAPKRKSTVLLATAVVWIEVANKRRKARILIDSASQSNFITEKFCVEMNLKIRPTSMVVSGIGQQEQISRGEVDFEVISRFCSNSRFLVSALVIPKITDSLPSAQLISNRIEYLRCLRLADDALGGPIDAILGASFFPYIWGKNKVSGPKNYPVAVESCLGYIVMGQLPNDNEDYSKQAFCTFSEEKLEQTLEKFWTVEEVPARPEALISDLNTEAIFEATITRDKSGRYVTSLPFKENPQVLGDSYEVALRRFINLERRLRYSPELRRNYVEVMTDYLNQGHMVEDKSGINSGGYYIPHHAVFKQESVSTKVRIVFDASCHTSSGKSLNEILLVGPKLYADLGRILLNFRLFPIAVTADIKQMFRMIRMREVDQNFQKILWRWSPDEPLKVYRLTTVVFGISSSPYLALKTVKQLIKDESENFPSACVVADKCLYMDDLAVSFLDSREAASTSVELIKLFKAGGFDLTKWASNSEMVIKEIPEEGRLSNMVNWKIDQSLKILGLHWDPVKDEFFYQINYCTRACTKRNILSTVARIFDPLGLLTPVTLWLKTLVKKLWLLNLEWDDTPPSYILDGWKQFENEFSSLEGFRIYRHLGVCAGSKVSIVGFSDASEKGYGAVVYCRVVLNTGDVQCNLVCGKSKVSPVQSLTIPRLELCGAYLLSKLFKIVMESFASRYSISNTFCFTDSTVVLSWIKGSPTKWKTFVGNRVAKIQDNVSSDQWFHIRGPDNPADLASRGCLPSFLKNHSLWWNGPEWLLTDENNWPVDTDVKDLDIERRVTTVLLAKEHDDNGWVDFFERCSTWQKLLRSFVYVLKFCKILPRRNGIRAEDLEEAENAILRLVQKQYFVKEFEALSKKRECSKQIQKLSPILVDGLVRVGGRLSQSNLSFDQKHPILLPPSSRVTQLIIKHYHMKNLHTGSYLLTSLLRQRYWILGVRNLTRKIVRNCNVCFRAKPKPNFPEMADLPACRIEETKAFSHVGVDMAGPVNITLSKHRGVRSQKAYIALFVCLVTKAIHLELVSELSTEAFMAAFRRFLARRGPCHTVYSDRGTNFIGMKNKLEESYRFFENSQFKENWENNLANNRIKWKVNPPSAPHFGGIWESNIKCVKSHLVKLVKDRLLSYEEFYTVLAQIEGILNSRPLYALSMDPNDPTALTPAHFLNLVPFVHLPLKEDCDPSRKVTHRFQLLSHLVRSFWNRWRLEYLHSLQVRNKWNKTTTPLKIGTVVLLNTENTLPMNWPLGIVTKIFPGKDGITRVVEVKTKSGTYTRPVVKLYPLPSQ